MLQRVLRTDRARCRLDSDNAGRPIEGKGVAVRMRTLIKATRSSQPVSATAKEPTSRELPAKLCAAMEVGRAIFEPVLATSHASQ
jgi:hypothetical protein